MLLSGDGSGYVTQWHVNKEELVRSKQLHKAPIIALLPLNAAPVPKGESRPPSEAPSRPFTPKKRKGGSGGGEDKRSMRDAEVSSTQGAHGGVRAARRRLALLFVAARSERTLGCLPYSVQCVPTARSCCGTRRIMASIR